LTDSVVSLFLSGDLALHYVYVIAKVFVFLHLGSLYLAPWLSGYTYIVSS